MRFFLLYAAVMLVAANAIGCKSAGPFFSEPAAAPRPSALSEDQNWAAKMRPRDRTVQPYFFDPQAQQIERNLGL